MARTKQRSVYKYRDGRRKILRRNKLNTLEDIPLPAAAAITPLSASSRKLNFYGYTLESLQSENRPTERENTDESDCYLLVQKSSLANLFSKLLCPICLHSSLQIITGDEVFGFSAKVTLLCRSCEEVVCEDYLCLRSGGSRSARMPFEVNQRATLAFRGIGCGYSAIKEWCSIMNMPYSLSQDAYTSNHNKIHEASKLTFQKVKDVSLTTISNAYAETGVLPDKDGILNISVSFDGAWQKRGHSSHNGVAAVIDLLTGLPIDYEVLSNFCLKCKIASEQPADKDWKEKHAPNCPKNFDGSANAMEVECAVRLWQRSEASHNLRYTTMLSDGDSKAYDAVVSAKVYGENTAIYKEECVNHVSKRMGTALKNLVAISKAQKQSISGKGKLTQEKILKIQNYYGRAIKDNTGDVHLLKKSIFAILFHLSSSDQNPKHMHCPSTWCFWQKALAQSKDPGSHKDHETLPSDIGKKLVPIFKRLSDDGLLKRCIRKKTQNPNESLHNIIWKLCPKSLFVGRKTMETAVSLAVCQFSMGASFREILCQTLGINVGKYLEEGSKEKNIKRIKRADKANLESSKKRRRQLKFKKSSQEKKKKDVEGSTYSAGSF